MHQTVTVQPALLRVTEAAAMLGISRTKAYELIQRGELRVLRIDTAVRIPRAEVDRWIASEMARAGITPDAPEVA